MMDGNELKDGLELSGGDMSGDCGADGIEMVANAIAGDIIGEIMAVLGGAAMPFMKGGRRGVVASARSRWMVA